jgi:hypothetical protein
MSALLSLLALVIASVHFRRHSTTLQPHIAPLARH